MPVLRPLVRKALWDSEEDLRPVAYEALKAIGHPDTAIYYVPFLGEESVSARIRSSSAGVGARLASPKTSRRIQE